MSKTKVQTNKNANKWDIVLNYARPNVFDELPRLELRNPMSSGFCRHLFTSLNQSVLDRFCLVTDEDSWELLMEDFKLNDVRYFCVKIGYDTTDSLEYEIADHFLRMIFDNGVVDDLGSLDVLLAEFGVLDGELLAGNVPCDHAIYYRGTVSSVMQNFYNVVTKYTDYRLSHVALVADKLVEILETFIFGCLGKLAFDQDGAIRFIAGDLNISVVQQMCIDKILLPSVKAVVGYIVDMAIVSAKVWNDVYEKDR